MRIGSLEWKRLIINGAHEMGLEIDSETADRFAIHADALMLWAQKTNLTTIRDPVEVAVKHYLDSLAPAARIPRNARALDAGSGGGFPGIPLKIMIPSLSITLIDASRKKISFLKQIIRTLELTAIEAIQGRVEALSPPSVFDVIVSRAVSDLSTFLRTATPLLAEDGMLIAFKTKNAFTEIAPFVDRSEETIITRPSLPGPFSVEIHSYRLPYLDLDRSLVIMQRVRDNSNPHSSPTFVGCAGGPSQYRPRASASPSPGRIGIILNAKWNKKTRF